jgi:hypothetical protein
MFVKVNLCTGATDYRKGSWSSIPGKENGISPPYPEQIQGPLNLLSRDYWEPFPWR